MNKCTESKNYRALLNIKMYTFSKQYLWNLYKFYVTYPWENFNTFNFFFITFRALVTNLDVSNNIIMFLIICSSESRRGRIQLLYKLPAPGNKYYSLILLLLLWFLLLLSGFLLLLSPTHLLSTGGRSKWHNSCNHPDPVSVDLEQGATTVSGAGIRLCASRYYAHSSFIHIIVIKAISSSGPPGCCRHTAGCRWGEPSSCCFSGRCCTFSCTGSRGSPSALHIWVGWDRMKYGFYTL